MESSPSGCRRRNAGLASLVLTTDVTSLRMPAHWFEINFSWLEFKVPLLAQVEVFPPRASTNPPLGISCVRTKSLADVGVEGVVATLSILQKGGQSRGRKIGMVSEMRGERRNSVQAAGELHHC